MANINNPSSFLLVRGNEGLVVLCVVVVVVLVLVLVPVLVPGSGGSRRHHLFLLF